MYSNTSGYVHMGLRLDSGKGITGQETLSLTHIPIPGWTLSVAGGGRGSNTTHALLNPDPETLPIGEGVSPSHRRVPWKQGAPRPTDRGSLCSLNGRYHPLFEPEIRPRHYPLGVGS